MENYININELPKINNGRIWYLVFLPIVACYLENFAINIYMGIFLWLLAIIICPLVCVADEKHLRMFGINDTDLRRFRLVPTIYMKKRLDITNQNSVPLILFIVFIIYAVLNNGFTQALRITDSTFTESVKSSYISSIHEYESLVTYDTVGERISAFADEKKVDWVYSQDDEYKYVTANFKADNQKISIVFRLDFDGYALKRTDLKTVTFADKELEGEERESLLYRIFLQPIDTIDSKTDRNTSSYTEA